VIVLQDDDLLVRLDPAHGAEILDLIDLQTGRQLLGRPPFGSEQPRPGDLDEESWTASYRGGWQLVAPSAGTPSTVDGTWHGFHGRASNDPWEVLDAGPRMAALAWTGHGLRIERRLHVDGGALEVAVEATALDARVPLVAVEHCSLGLELLEPEVLIELPAGVAYEQSETEGPPDPPAGAARWPEVTLLDGTTERADRWSLVEQRSRFFVVADLPEGRAVVRNPARNQALELTWDATWLRHCWVWHEARSYGGAWREHAEVLVVEPASVPHSMGLAAAIEHGHARWLEPGELATYGLTARPLRG
jgi:hypothetical protein